MNRTVARVLTTVALLLPLAATAAPAHADPVSLTSGFYVNPTSSPALWARNNAADARSARIQSSIGSRPIGRWFGNTESGGIGAAVSSYVGAADSHDKLPILVAYNLPGRDACGGESAGGAGSVGAYRTWIATFAAAVAARPAVVIIEPDALGDFDCMSEAAVQDRVGMLSYAVAKFREKAPQTWVYLDGGNAGWVGAATMAARLTRAGVAGARGFAVNVSNFYSTSASTTYANNVNAALGYAAKYVIDTSRNGNGSNGVWCNPPGRRLGTPPQLGGGGAEMLLWIKTPGNSDGTCGTAPSTPAGQFNPDLAVRLIDGT